MGPLPSAPNGHSSKHRRSFEWRSIPPGPASVRRILILGQTQRRWLKDRQPGRASPHSHQPNTRGTPGRYIVSAASMTRPAASIEPVTGRVR